MSHFLQTLYDCRMGTMVLVLCVEYCGIMGSVSRALCGIMGSVSRALCGILGSVSRALYYGIVG